METGSIPRPSPEDPMRTLLAAGAALLLASPAPSLSTIGQPADDGARMVQVEPLDARTRDLTIESPAVGTVQVRLLLPAGSVDGAASRYPVLYLLHGGGGEYTDWTEETDVETIPALERVLVAMPAAASSRMGTLEPTGGAVLDRGRPHWEDFHLVELQQLLERNWQASDARAVGGLSLGGYGAVMYAARHPGTFRAAASYSGVLDVTVAPGSPAEARALADSATALAEDLGWDQVNPINLVPSLAGTMLYISYGNGDPGPLDPAGTEHDPLEAWVGAGDDHFVAALEDAGIPATVDAYGPGTHSWSYWDRELHESLESLTAALLSDATPSPSIAP
jgi:S-formylglutathione hydrolase FrmB